jgi:hypothetical protein
MGENGEIGEKNHAPLPGIELRSPLYYNDLSVQLTEGIHFFFELEPLDSINSAQPTRWPPSQVHHLVHIQATKAY